MQDYFGVFGWLSAHIHVAGWIIICWFFWRTSAKWETFVSKMSLADKVVKESHDTISIVATNHLPHLQEGINRIDDSVQKLEVSLVSELKGVRSDLLQYALRKND